VDGAQIGDLQESPALHLFQRARQLKLAIDAVDLPIFRLAVPGAALLMTQADRQRL
jgi:hypothetical protein